MCQCFRKFLFMELLQPKKNKKKKEMPGRNSNKKTITHNKLMPSISVSKDFVHELIQLKRKRRKQIKTTIKNANIVFKRNTMKQKLHSSYYLWHLESLREMHTYRYGDQSQEDQLSCQIR